MTPSPADTGTDSGTLPHVELLAVSKAYEGIQALDNVTLRIARGGVHALVGENGAGKSTLGKIIAGAEVPDAGRMLASGADVYYRSPRDALAAGIALVHQETSVVPGLSVIDNVFLGVERTRWGVVRNHPQAARFQELAAELGFAGDPDLPVAALGIADKQKVEIMRALARDGDLIVLDEPTAALTSHEATLLHGVIRGLCERRVTFVYISHDLREVLSIADNVSVLKDGRLVSTNSAGAESVGTLVRAMLGRSLEGMFPAKRETAASAPMALRVKGLSRAGVISDISFHVRAGEIVGLAGLVGSGRSEVGRAIFGADMADDGLIEVNGQPLRIRSPRHAVREGIVMLPENRKEQALLMHASVRANLTLPSVPEHARFAFVRRRSEYAYAQELVDRLDIRTPSLETPVATLSGGNQQKVAFGKWLGRAPSVLIADEPTRGVDVGARPKIYKILRSLADQNVAVLLISSELEDIMGLAERILVMHRGRIVDELPGNAPEGEILAAAFGEP